MYNINNAFCIFSYSTDQLWSWNKRSSPLATSQGSHLEFPICCQTALTPESGHDLEFPASLALLYSNHAPRVARPAKPAISVTRYVFACNELVHCEKKAQTFPPFLKAKTAKSRGSVISTRGQIWSQKSAARQIYGGRSSGAPLFAHQKKIYSFSLLLKFTQKKTLKRLL